MVNFSPNWPSGPSWSSSHNVRMSICLSVFNFFLGLPFTLRSHYQIPSTHCGINILKNVKLNNWPSDHDQIPSTHCGINTLKNFTLNYWPSDHMISSGQPIVASIPWKNDTLNYWLLAIIRTHRQSWCLQYVFFMWLSFQFSTTNKS